MNDSEILDLYWDRKEQAITETQNSYGRYCYGIAYHILHDKEDSEHYLELFSAKAVPEEGHEFLGWYDLDGNLVSTDAEIIIQDCYGNYPNLVDLVGSTTVHVIARFSE